MFCKKCLYCLLKVACTVGCMYWLYCLPCPENFKERAVEENLKYSGLNFQNIFQNVQNAWNFSKFKRRGWKKGNWKYSGLNVQKVFTTVNCHFYLRNGAHVPWITTTPSFQWEWKLKAQKVIVVCFENINMASVAKFTTMVKTTFGTNADFFIKSRSSSPGNPSSPIIEQLFYSIIGSTKLWELVKYWFNFPPNGWLFDKMVSLSSLCGASAILRRENWWHKQRRRLGIGRQTNKQRKIVLPQKPQFGHLLKIILTCQQKTCKV